MTYKPPGRVVSIAPNASDDEVVINAVIVHPEELKHVLPIARQLYDQRKVLHRQQINVRVVAWFVEGEPCIGVAAYAASMAEPTREQIIRIFRKINEIKKLRQAPVGGVA
jgi:hypothetical protein